jgi:hypothetical protein
MALPEMIPVPVRFAMACEQQCRQVADTSSWTFVEMMGPMTAPTGTAEGAVRALGGR